MKHICRSPIPRRRRRFTPALLVCSLHIVTLRVTSFSFGLASTGDRCSGCGGRRRATGANFTNHTWLLPCLWRSCFVPARDCAVAASRAKTSSVRRRTSRQSSAGCHRLSCTFATGTGIRWSSLPCWMTHQMRALLDHFPSGAERPNQAMQRTASKAAFYVRRVCHPRFACVACCSGLAVADLVSR
jgi:hypothetical protein